MKSGSEGKLPFEGNSTKWKHKAYHWQRKKPRMQYETNPFGRFTGKMIAGLPNFPKQMRCHKIEYEIRMTTGRNWTTRVLEGPVLRSAWFTFPYHGTIGRTFRKKYFFYERKTVGIDDSCFHDYCYRREATFYRCQRKVGSIKPWSGAA